MFWTHLGDRIADLLPETKGYSYSISGVVAQHIFNNHGDEQSESSRGQIAVTKEDLARIPDIVSNYDYIRTDMQDEMGTQRVAYAKRYDDAVVLYLEAVSRRKRDFRGVTLFRYPPTADAESKLASSFDPTTNGQNRLGAYLNDNTTDHVYQDSRGFYSRQQQLIALLPHADASTFIHESGHFFLDRQMEIAQDLLNRPSESLSATEQAILN